MTRIAHTVEQELADFQAFITEVMPWGAKLTRVDEHYQPIERPGVPEIMVSCVTVLDVGLNIYGAYYVVNFGPEDVYGPATQDETDPSQSWTLTITDPVVDLRTGRWAIEMLDERGQSFRPEEWLLINPMLLPGNLLAIHDARGLI